MHEKTNALNSSEADAHEKGGNIFCCFVKLFSKRKISRQAAIAFKVSAPGPVCEISSVCTRMYFLFAEKITRGTPCGALCWAGDIANISYCFFFTCRRGPLLKGSMIHSTVISWP